MSCCGGQRRGMIRAAAQNHRTDRAVLPIGFVYTGDTSLTVVGGATGRSYRFDHPGCRLEVQARDAPGLSSMAMLQRVG